MTKLTKTQDKRFDEKLNATDWLMDEGYEADTALTIGEVETLLEHYKDSTVKQHLANELSLQKEELIKKLRAMQDKSQSSSSLVWNDMIDQAIKILEEL